MLMLYVKNRFTERYLKIFLNRKRISSRYDFPTAKKKGTKKMYLPTQQVDVCYQQNRSMLQILKHPKVFTVD